MPAYRLHARESARPISDSLVGATLLPMEKATKMLERARQRPVIQSQQAALASEGAEGKIAPV